MSKYFTKEKVEDAIKNNNWVLKSVGNGLYFLEEKDKSYMKTILFNLDDETAKKYL